MNQQRPWHKNKFNKNNQNNGRPHFQHRHPQQHHSQNGRSNAQTELEQRFLNKISIDPFPRINLESGLPELTTRALDILCPIGKGQRGLIVSPPKSGKTTILKHICQAITAAEPTMKVYCLLVDERPEEVTDFRRNVKAEVRWSTSDQPYENHIRVAQALMAQAMAEADSGLDVMVLVDSLTRLSRVHNNAVRHTGRTLSGGVDAAGLQIPRRIFGSARKIENGGSLGIIATILVQTGSRMDDVIFQEFKGTGNMEIVLSREVSERRIFPALNIKASGTRKEELLFSPEDLKSVHTLRQALASMDEVLAAQTFVDLLKKYPTNKQLLGSLR